jgi:hypothetical protein
MDEFDRHGHGHRGLAGRPRDLAGGERRERTQAFSRREDRVVNRAGELSRPGGRRRQAALERFLERGAVGRREAIEGEGAATGGGSLQGFAAYPRKLAIASDSDS